MHDIRYIIGAIDGAYILQAIIFTKVWNKDKDTMWKYMPRPTNQVRYHYKHKGFLYDLHFTQAVVPMYIKDFEGKLKTLKTKYDQCLNGLGTSMVMIINNKDYNMGPKNNN